MIAVADPRFLAQVGSPDLVAASAVVSGVSALIGIGVYVWYAFALSKLFPKLEQDGWKGWVPVLNEATILQIGGRPAWNVVFYFIPIVQLYGLYLKVLATHEINKRFGRGAGFTVLAILLPPVWATMLAWGAPPYPEGDRLASLHGPRRIGSEAARAAGAPSAQGYLAPPIPHGGPVPPAAPGAYAPESFAPPAATGHAPQGFVPQPPVPGAPAQAAFDPRFSQDPAPDATIPAPYRPAAQAADPATGLPVAAQGQPASPPPAASLPIPQGLIDSVPGVAPHAAPAPHAEPAPSSGASQPFGAALPAPAGTASEPGPSAPAADAAQFAPAPPAPAFPAAPPFGAAPPAAPAPQDSVAPAAAPVQPGYSQPFVPAQPAAPAPQDSAAPATAPARPGYSQPFVPADAAGTMAPAQPAAADGAHSAESASQAASEDLWATVASVPPAPAAPVPSADPADARASAGVEEEVPAPPASAPEAEPADPFAEPQRLRGSGLGTRAERAASIRPVPVVLPVPETPAPVPAAVPADDDDLEATVVVQRSRGPRRVLALDDGRTFALSATSIVIGRNPEGEPGEQRLAIPDKTRTLSKTHARLVVQGDEWRLTDLHSTNGVVVVADDGAETLLDPGESVTGAGRFVLGEVGMHVAVESDS